MEIAAKQLRIIALIPEQPDSLWVSVKANRNACLWLTISSTTYRGVEVRPVG